MAEQLVNEALQIGTDGGQPDAFVIYGAEAIMVTLWRGTLGSLIPLIEQTITDNPRLPVLLTVLALAYAESEQVD